MLKYFWQTAHLADNMLPTKESDGAERLNNNSNVNIYIHIKHTHTIYMYVYVYTYIHIQGILRKRYDTNEI